MVDWLVGILAVLFSVLFLFFFGLHGCLVGVLGFYLSYLVFLFGVLLNILGFHLTYMFLFGIHGAFLAYLEFGKRTWGFVWHTWYIGWRTWFLFGVLGVLVGIHGVFVIGILFDFRM